MEATLGGSLHLLPYLPAAKVGAAIKRYMQSTTYLMARRMGLVEKTVVIDGLPWKYLERPETGLSTAGGRCTVFFHGLSMNAFEFIPAAYFLRSLPGRLLLLPTPGHDCDNYRPDTEFMTVEQSTAWFAKLARTLRLVDYNIVGYSLGASSALSLASSSYGVRRVVCLNPGFAEAVGDLETRLKMTDIYAYKDGPTARAFVERCLVPQQKSYQVAPWVGEFFHQAIPLPHFAREYYAHMMSTYEEDLTRLWMPRMIERGVERAPPVLVIASEGDQVIRLDVVRELCAEWKSAGLDVTFCTQPGYGHWFGAEGSTVPRFWSYFETVAPRVLDFLDCKPRPRAMRKADAYPALEQNLVLVKRNSEEPGEDTEASPEPPRKRRSRSFDSSK
jgi:pimeloyl-ACP methyl ester carboxylesterase